MHNELKVGELLVALLTLAIEGAVLVFFIVMTCVSYRQVAANWRRGLLWGVLAMILGLPVAVLGLIYLDVARLAPDVPTQLLGVVKVIGGIVAAGLMLLMIPLRGMYYLVSVVEWGRLRGPGDSALVAGAPRWLGIAVGLAVGVFAGIASMGIFYWLDVNESREVLRLAAMFPGVQEAPSAIIMVSTLGFVIAAAIVEEFIFRGGMLGFLLRIGGNRTALAWLAIAGTAGLWAILHIANTDRPVLKVMQIFLLGLAFGAMARKWGLASCIAGHVSLNVVAVIISMAGQAME